MRDQWRALPALNLIGVLGFYALVTGVVTWPLLAQFSSNLVGFKDADQVQKVWAFWHTKEALLRGANPAYLDTLVYPQGYFSPIRWASLTMHVMLLPFEVVLSPVPAYNASFLLSYVLTGYAGYLLCRDITGHTLASLFGGLVMMLFPTRVAQAIAGHVEAANLSLALWYVLLLRRTLREPTIRRAVLTGVVLALACMMHPTAPPYVLAPLTGLYVLYHQLESSRGFFHRQTWGALAIALGVAILVLLPFFIPLVTFGLNPPEYAFEGGAELAALSTDGLGYITPSPQNPIFASLRLVPPFADEVLGFFLPEIIAYLGIVTVVFAGLAVVRQAPESREWLLIMLVAMILAMGPFLKVGGAGIPFALNPEQPIPLPYALVARLPLYQLGRTPGRFNLLTGTCLGLLAAQGVATWLKRPTGWRVFLVGVAAVVMAGEYLVVWPMEVDPVSVPESVESLAAKAPDGGVLNIPANRYATHYAQFYQTMHGWPIMGGYSDRVIPQAPGVREMLEWIGQPQEASDIVPVVAAEDARGLLAELDVAYVLLHKRFATDVSANEAWLESMLGDPVESDETLVLYAVRPAPMPDGLIYALSGPGWGETEGHGGESARQLAREGRLVIYAPEETTGDLRLAAATTGTSRQLQVMINGGGGRRVRINAPGEYFLEDVSLDAGLNLLHFEVLDTECEPNELSPGCSDILFQTVELIGVR